MIKLTLQSRNCTNANMNSVIGGSTSCRQLSISTISFERFAQIESKGYIGLYVLYTLINSSANNFKAVTLFKI